MAWLAAPWFDASGVCHSDSVTVAGRVPFISYPRVSGHEIVGRVDSVGQDVSQWKLGQRVDIGWYGGQWRPRRRSLPFPIHSRASMRLHCSAPHSQLQCAAQFRRQASGHRCGLGHRWLRSPLECSLRRRCGSTRSQSRAELSSRKGGIETLLNHLACLFGDIPHSAQ